MNGCEMKWKGCGRIDPHPGHHWYGQREYIHYTPEQRPVFWCKGEFILEGASPHGRPHTVRSR